AQRADGAITIVLINKTAGALTSPLAFANVTALGPAAAWQYSAADLTHISRVADVSVTAPTVSITLPAASITLLAIPGPPPGVLTGDGMVNSLDATAFINVLLGYDPSALHVLRADVNADNIVNAADIAPFIAALLR